MPAAPSESTLHILVVDDEPDVEFIIRQRLRRRIRKGEVQLSFASDGIDALEVLSAHDDIAIMLTDVNMPRMDGLTLLRRINELKRAVKAIVVTAYGDMENIRKAMNWGAFDFLVKPLDLDDLDITLEQATQALRRERKALRAEASIGLYLSPEVASSVLDSPEGLTLGGQKVQATLLMSDLRGFSTLSERLAPEDVVEVLNIYLGAMAEVIDSFQGTINEFIGDAIFVIFGAPTQRPDDADRAVACAIQMQNRMAEVNATLAEKGFPALDMGIGIHTGEVIVGNIGSKLRMKYGAVGSSVNLTSRIESYTVGGQVLISEATRHALAADVQIGREMEISTKGFAQPVRILEAEGIGAPFSVKLPVVEVEYIKLDEPLAVQVRLLDGKRTRSATYEGALTHLASGGARLRVDTPLKRLDNLKLIIPPSADSKASGDLYAKVMDASTSDLVLRFTAVPEDLAAYFNQQRLGC
ncbi:MAG: adenylate/guanylate cyclase domain-containing protein [Bacteroidota bacterium]